MILFILKNIKNNVLNVLLKLINLYTIFYITLIILYAVKNLNVNYNIIKLQSFLARYNATLKNILKILKCINKI